jgi:hypothetical protein
MALPIGWYTDPTPGNENLCLLWDGKTVAGPLEKTEALRYCAETGQPAPVFMEMDISPASAPAPSQPVTITAVPERGPLMTPTAHNAGWLSTSKDEEFGQGKLMAYWDGSGIGEYFALEPLINEVVLPEFLRQGGSSDWWENGALQGTADHQLFWTIFNRITPEHAKAIIGETAPMYNNGPTWIADKDNPNLARWWDGRKFTGEIELFGVIQQRSFDAETGNTETVSYAPGLSGSEAGSLQVDPDDPTQLIRWGGARWDRRVSIEDKIKELFDSLGETVPQQWTGVQVMSPRHADLIKQLSARKNGINGWYKEPERFDDLRMRVWHDGQWTDQTSQQVPGLYDDPFNDELLREWSVNGWTDKIVTKEAERVRIEREVLRQEKRQAFKEKVLVAVADHYSPENMRQRRIDDQNDRSRRLRDAAAAASLEHHQGANNYYAQKDFDRMWRGKR